MRLGEVEVEVFGRLVEAVIICHQQLEAAHLVVVPAVEAAHLADVGEDKQFVIVLKTCFVDSRDGEFPGTDLLLDEISQERIAELEAEAVGKVARDKDVGRAFILRELEDVALLQVLAEERPVEIAVDAFEDDAFEICIRLQDTRLRGESLDVSDAGIRAEGGEQ